MIAIRYLGEHQCKMSGVERVVEMELTREVIPYFLIETPKLNLDTCGEEISLFAQPLNFALEGMRIKGVITEKTDDVD